MSDNVNFEEYINKERARLTEARESLMAERQSIDARIAALGNEFAAIAAYEAAKTGKLTASAPRRTRARNGSRRDLIMNVLAAAPNGMTRGELLDHLGVKGDKAGEMSVSNALTATQKAGQIVRRDDGRWVVVAAESGLRQAAE